MRPPQPYLTAVVSVRAQTATDLGWLLVTRQPLDKALQPIARLHTLLALLMGLMAALLAGLAYWVARRFSRAAGAPGPGRTRSASHRAGGRTPRRCEDAGISAPALGAAEQWRKVCWRGGPRCKAPMPSWSSA